MQRWNADFLHSGVEIGWALLTGTQVVFHYS